MKKKSKKIETAPLFAPLTVGGTYTIMDVYGMVSWQGTYEGVIEDEHSVNVNEESLLLFKAIEGSTGSGWGGVIATTRFNNYGIEIVLVSYYYGSSPDSLKRWNETAAAYPKWVKV